MKLLTLATSGCGWSKLPISANRRELSSQTLHPNLPQRVLLWQFSKIANQGLLLSQVAKKATRVCSQTRLVKWVTKDTPQT